MMGRAHVLAIDLGTTGPKVALVADDGTLVARAVRPVRTRMLAGGGVEQDADEIWGAVVDAAREALASASPASVASVVGVVCDSHYFSLIPVDEHGNAVAPCILWMDQRGAVCTQEVYRREPGAPARWSEVHGLPALPTGNDSLAHLLHVRDHRPEVYERAAAFVEPADYLNARLTGRVAANLCTAYPLLLTDNRDLGNPRYDDELLRMTGVDIDRLPALLAVDEPVGPLRSEVAAELGLEAGTPVFSGMNDTQAVAVGAGTFQPGRGGVNIGTTTQVLAHVDGMRGDLERSIVSMPSAIPQRYMVCAENGLGGKLVEHFLHEIVYPDDALARHGTADAYGRVESAVAGEPVGSGRLLFLPWYGGVQAPVSDPSMRGGFLNMSLSTTRTRMLRAVVEGICYNMRWTLPAVESVAQCRFAELRFSGGAAVSDTWSQILADVTGRRVLQVDDARYLNARGAAFVAFLHAGLTASERIDDFCPIRETYSPRPAAQEIYDRMFDQFVRARGQNSEIYKALNEDPVLRAGGKPAAATGDVGAVEPERQEPK